MLEIAARVRTHLLLLLSQLCRAGAFPGIRSVLHRNLRDQLVDACSLPMLRRPLELTAEDSNVLPSTTIELRPALGSNCRRGVLLGIANTAFARWVKR